MPSTRPEIGKPLPRHPAFTREAQARRWWRVSYRVDHLYAEEVDACGSAVVYRHEVEDPESYARRKATLKPHKIAAPIIERYGNHVFRRPPARVDATGAAKQVIDDADTTGRSLDALMRKALRFAQNEGVVYLLVRSTSDSEQAQTMTAAQAQAMGARPEVTIVRADCVVDWANDHRGELAEATVLYERDGAQVACVYRADTKQEITLDAKGVVTAIGAEEAHGFDSIPLVRFDPLGDQDMEPARDVSTDAGRRTEVSVRSSQISGLAESQQAFNNTLSLIRDHCYATNFAMLVLAGASPEQFAAPAGGNQPSTPKVQVGSKQALFLPQGAEAEFIGGRPEVAEGLFQTLSLDLDHLLRTAGLATTDAEGSKAAQSGVSRAFQFADASAIVSSLSQATAAAERRVWVLIADAWPSIQPPTVAYAEADAGMADFAADLADTLKVAVLSAAPAWLRRHVFQRFAQRHLAPSQELGDEIEASAEAEDPLEQPATEDQPRGRRGAPPPNSQRRTPQEQ